MHPAPAPERPLPDARVREPSPFSRFLARPTPLPDPSLAVPRPFDPVALFGQSVLALAFLFAARSARTQSESDRNGLDYWQRRQQWLASSEGELHKARLQYELKRAAERKEKEKEIMEAAARARQAALEKEKAQVS